ncbi:MAG: TlpA family protein disulfide reductase [Phycisphaerae bacterium]|jgi:hypothetical protein
MIDREQRPRAPQRDRLTLDAAEAPLARCGRNRASTRRRLPIVLSLTLAVTSHPAPAQPVVLPPDERLWQEIRSLAERAPGPSSALAADAELARLGTLCDRAQTYLTLYPGGPHRDDAARLDLAARFEIGARGGGFERLCQRVRDLERVSLGPAIRAEAAYWAITCRRLTRPLPATQPQVGDLELPDSGLLAEYRAYVQEFPESRHAPPLAGVLLADAERRSAIEDVRPLIAAVERAHPADAFSACLAATIRRHDAIGRPFPVRFVAADERRVDTASWVGRPVAIVVWAAQSPRSVERAREVERLRREHSDLAVVGVSLDDDPASTVRAARELGLDWPQWSDGFGAAHEFVREWGLSSAPWVLAIDRHGRLVGAECGADWDALVRAALQN